MATGTTDPDARPEPSPPQLGSMQFVDPHRAPGGAERYLVLDPLPDRAGDGSHELVAGMPAVLDAAFPAEGRMMDVAEWLTQTATTSLLAISHGQVVHEWYADGLGRDTLFLGASAGKSLLAHLVGQASETGRLQLTDTVADLVPELAGSGYAAVPIRELTSMTSGVDWVEDHRDPAGPATRLLNAFTERHSSRELLREVGSRCPPGTRYEYNTADSQVLDWARERATGVPFADAARKLLGDLGSNQPIAVAVDGDGVALAGGGLAMTTRDWARVGLLQCHGRWHRALVGRPWTAWSSTPRLPFVGVGRLPASLSARLGFGAHWWPLTDDGARVAADGSRGQFIYLDRPRAVVVVKTSAWEYPDPMYDRRCRDLSYLGLAAVAESVGAPPLARHENPSGERKSA